MRYRIRKWREDCWTRLFSLFREHNLQRLQSKQEESTEEEAMKQQHRMVEQLTHWTDAAVFSLSSGKASYRRW